MGLIDRRTFIKRSGAAAAGTAVIVALPETVALAGADGSSLVCSIPTGLRLFTAPPDRSGTLTGSMSLPEGFTVPAGQTLELDPNVSTTVTVKANVIVEGTLEMKPAHAGIQHALIFEDVDESLFVGGGLDPVDTDVGLWVIGAGRLDISGTPKTAWNRAGDDATWSGTDELRVAPTARGDYGTDGFPTFTRGAKVPSVANPYGGPGAPASLTFIDTAGSVHAADIEAIRAAGITKGCNPPTNNLYCPTDYVTRGQMAAFLARALDLPTNVPSAGFVDTVGHLFEEDIDRIAAAGITKGCNPPDNTRFCPDDHVTREQMASFLVRAFDYPPGPAGRFVDTAGSVHEADIEALAAQGVTKGCNPPTNDRYCPKDFVTREQMASFLARALGLEAPALTTDWYAEVLNLTRNVRIEGTPGGRSHLFIRTTSNVAQSIKYCVIRHFGPRNFPSPGEFPDRTGRYGMHFHLAGDTTRGSIVEGVVIRDTSNHAFVPHGSNGITFRNCISYDTSESAYWWDPKDVESADILWESCVAALVHGVDGSQEAIRLSGFDLQAGPGNAVHDSVAVGVQGGIDSSGFGWQERAAAHPWDVQRVVAHNNLRNGFFLWHNIPLVHGADVFTLYRNGAHAIEHGAYVNPYDFNTGTLFENGAAALLLHAVNNEGGIENPGHDLTFRNLTFDGGGLVDHLVESTRHVAPPAGPTKFRNCTFTGAAKTPVGLIRTTGSNPDLMDFIDCGLTPDDVHWTEEAHDDFRVRIQNGSTAWSITKAGVVSIAPFD